MPKPEDAAHPPRSRQRVPSNTFCPENCVPGLRAI
jgi:hypothetical protein